MFLYISDHGPFIAGEVNIVGFEGVVINHVVDDGVDAVDGPAGAEGDIYGGRGDLLQDKRIDGDIGTGTVFDAVDIFEENTVVVLNRQRVHGDDAVDTARDFGSYFGVLEQVVKGDFSIGVGEVFAALLRAETDGDVYGGLGFEEFFESTEEDDRDVFGVNGQRFVVVVFGTVEEDVVIEQFQEFVLNGFGHVHTGGCFRFEEFVEFVEDEDRLFTDCGVHGTEVVAEFVGTAPALVGEGAGIEDTDEGEFGSEDAPDLGLAAAGGAAEEIDAGRVHAEVVVEDQGGGFHGPVLADDTFFADEGFELFRSHIGGIVDGFRRRNLGGEGLGPEGAVNRFFEDFAFVFSHKRVSFRKDPY